jgi:hypothetical protein
MPTTVNGFAARSLSTNARVFAQARNSIEKLTPSSAAEVCLNIYAVA